MANPVLNEKFLENTNVITEPLTIQGVIQKTIVLFTILVASAAFLWMKGIEGHADLVLKLTIVGAITGFVLAFLICFTKKMFLTPLHAVAEGLFIGGFSFVMEKYCPGIVQTATLGTFITVATMLVLYSTRIIKFSDKLMGIVLTATIAVAGIYFIQWVGSLFGLSIPGIFDNGTFGIVFNLVVIGIAALNLIVDFHFIETAANTLMPKEYEWYFGFSIMITVVWVYVEIVRLLVKYNSRD